MRESERKWKKKVEKGRSERKEGKVKAREKEENWKKKVKRKKTNKSEGKKEKWSEKRGK